MAEQRPREADQPIGAEPAAAVDQARVEEIIEEYETEARTRHLAGRSRVVIAALAIATSLLALYYATATIQAQLYRPVFLALCLVLIFLYYPMANRWRDRFTPVDLLLAVLAVLAIGYVLWDYEEFIFRSARPNTTDLIAGALTILLVLEATRRTTGWILPAVTATFLVYAYLPRLFRLPPPWDHRGYEVDRVVGHVFMTTEGIFGVPLDVASSFIILFTIYGAVLEFSGAGKFFIDFSFGAMGRKRSGAGRTATLASFLLGTVSGSGVATTVTLGSIAWPMMRKAGYDADSAGGVLSAGGIGAILSPPVLGAAAFLIAEFLRVSYLEVLVMATVPTLLYYLAVFLMIEIDARKMGTREVGIDAAPMGQLLRRHGYHFTSLFLVIGLMAAGLTPIYAVFWSIAAAVALSFLDRENALRPRRLGRALESGSLGVLGVAATTAAAGIIVGITTLTGLGLKISGIIVGLAGGNLFLTLLFTCVAVWILGLAVPVTASYIIAAVMTVPALTQLGVPDFAAHMFIFYYAVLSEVTPPTALSPFAAAAITGGNPYKTTMLAWKYTAVAFIVPFMFTLDPAGVGLLLKGDVLNMVVVTVTAGVGILALVAGIGGWLRLPTNALERALLVIAGLVLIYPAEPWGLVGLALFGAAAALHYVRTRTVKSLPPAMKISL